MPNEGLRFVISAAAGWILIFVALEAMRRAAPWLWPAPPPAAPQRRGLDLLLAVLVPVAILLLGQAWFAGWLRWHWSGAWDHLAYLLAQVLIWSPLWLVLWWRHQSVTTLWLPRDHLWLRVGAGALLGCLGAVAYLAMTGDLARLPGVLARAATLPAWAHALPVLLEGCGVAFVFVRLQWALGRAVAALVPGVLFALAHVPRALEAGDPVEQIVLICLMNTALVALLLVWMQRFRDMVTIGVAHWLWDLAIDAF